MNGSCESNEFDDLLCFIAGGLKQTICMGFVALAFYHGMKCRAMWLDQLSQQLSEMDHFFIMGLLGRESRIRHYASWAE